MTNKSLEKIKLYHEDLEGFKDMLKELRKISEKK